MSLKVSPSISAQISCNFITLGKKYLLAASTYREMLYDIFSFKGFFA